jgi:ATP-binding cassette subfamily B multidrug efflux pump
MGYLRRYRGSYLLGALLIAAFQGLMWARDYLFKLGVDAVVARRAGETQKTVAVIVGIVVLATVVEIRAHATIYAASLRAQVSQRTWIVDRIHALGASFSQTMPAGEILSRATSDVEQVNRLLGAGILSGIDAAFAVVSALSVMLDMSARLTAVSLVPVLTLVLVTRSYAQALYPPTHAAQVALGKLSERFEESIAGTRAVRVSSLEPSELKGLEAASQELLSRSLSVARVEGVLLPVMGFVSGSAALIVVWYGGLLVLRGEITHGEFIAFWAALARLTVPLGMIGMVTSSVQRGRVSLARVNGILDAAPIVVDGPLPAPARVEGRLEVRGLNFAFGDEAVLHDVSFRVEPGHSLAVVGPIGGGKSTLAKLLARLLATPRGGIFLDGVDVCDLPVAFVRKAIGYAQQDPFLFSTTLATNLSLGLQGAPREEVMARVRDAAQGVRLREMIEAMPEGLRTVVGQRGLQLSGGQRQRAGLARAFVDGAPILVLDDPLSAVDAATAKAVLATIHRRASGKTLIVITGSVTVASTCERVVVLAGGRIFEEGTHAQLKVRNGLYGTLARAQEIEESIASSRRGVAVASGEDA